MSKNRALQKKVVLIGVAAVFIAVLIALLPKPQRASKAPQTEQLEQHTLIYGGDFFSARRLNLSLYDPQERHEIVEHLAPVFKKADLAMVNLEGLISVGGYYNRMLSNTYMFRAHPLLIPVLKEAGIDLLTVGNNHTPDYGPEALVEQLDRLRQAEIGFTGAGYNRKDARRPVYRKVGDVVVAIVGFEMTNASRYKAEDDRAGTHYVYQGFKKKKHDKRIIEHLARMQKEARKHAHVVFFSPHWDAGTPEPEITEPMRDMAEKLIEAGYDGILAHGRHHIQGVEVFDGKPVMYDVGNLVLDYNVGDDEYSRALLWQLSFSKAGIHQIEGVPVKIYKNRTKLAKGKEREKILDRLEKLSRAYGTEIRIDGERAYVDLDPGGVRPPTEPDKELPKRSAPKNIRIAPNDVIHETLPEGVTPLAVEYENGIKLLGYELINPEVSARKRSSQTIVLYWQATQPLTDRYVVHLEARHHSADETKKPRVIGRDIHIPGDWMLPTPMWPVGKVIQDKTNLRLVARSEPVGEVAFYMGLRKKSEKKSRRTDGDFIAPTKHADIELFKKYLLPIGRQPFSKEVPRIRVSYQKWREERKIELAEEQPWGAPPLYWDRLESK